VKNFCQASSQLLAITVIGNNPSFGRSTPA
jgi:hypothetical protein